MNLSVDQVKSGAKCDFFHDFIEKVMISETLFF